MADNCSGKFLNYDKNKKLISLQIFFFYKFFSSFVIKDSSYSWLEYGKFVRDQDDCRVFAMVLFLSLKEWS